MSINKNVSAVSYKFINNEVLYTLCRQVYYQKKHMKGLQRRFYFQQSIFFLNYAFDKLKTFALSLKLVFN